MPLAVTIVGAGIVGVCTALSLQDRGHAVTLIDRDEPLSRASSWNAGVLATSSLWPMVNPGLARQAPGLLLGRAPRFRVNPASLAAVVPFARRALRASAETGFRDRVAALDHLIGLSRRRHESLMDQTRTQALRTDNGWLFLFETAGALAAATPQTDAFARHEVAFEVLGGAELAQFEPHLAPRFQRALWLSGSAWVREPADLGRAYLDWFLARGGVLRRAAIAGLNPGASTVRLSGGGSVTADRVVIAAGPWSRALLATAGLSLPMISERGYLRRLGLQGNAGLNRPVYDTARGIVLSPRPDGIQISTGTELCDPRAPRREGQARAALARARLVLPGLGAPVDGLRSAERPTLPDSLPVIGPLTSAPQVWLATGHQHIGFSTSAGTGELIAEGITTQRLPDWTGPFAPARFGL